MPTLEELLQGLPSPPEMLWAGAFPCFLALLLGGIAARRSADSEGGAWGAVLGLVAGYLSGHAVLYGWPDRFPPLLAVDWMLVVAALVLASTLWVSTATEGGVRGLVVQAVAALAAVSLTLRPRIEAAGWDTGEASAQALIVGGPVFLGWLLMGSSARRRPARESLLALVLVAGATSLAVGMSGSQKLAQAAGAVAAGLTGLLLLSLRSSTGGRGLGAGAAPVTVALVGSLAMNGTLYAELGRDLHVLCVAPFVIAPLTGVLAGWKRDQVVGDVVRAALIASPAIVAAVLAITRFEAEPDNPYY